MRERMDEGISALIRKLQRDQMGNGSWQYRFTESGMMTDANMLILIRTLELDKPDIVGRLTDRILNRQLADGSWNVYPDETDGNLSATVECYFGLLHAGVHPDEPYMLRAKNAIVRRGGIRRVDSLITKFMLAIIGQIKWTRFFPVPLALIMLPPSSPINFFQFSGYARVHMAPMLLLADSQRTFQVPEIPVIQEFQPSMIDSSLDDSLWDPYFRSGMLEQLKQWAEIWKSAPAAFKERAVRTAERYMLDRIESDGTLYSYASSTMLMIYALQAIGYERSHPVIQQALQGLNAFLRPDSGGLHLQTTTSTVWDTALISHALSQAGVSPLHSSIQNAGRYLLSRQHAKLGDWQLQVQDPEPGGWGFSDINTINPDVDDTTAALRAIEPLRSSSWQAAEAAERGLQWLLSMQNDDGGWAAFERNNNHPLMKWIPLEGAEAAATDPSSADLTGRTLEYLGRTVGLTGKHPFVRRAVSYLYRTQRQDGSWYGRWGVCYIYGTWAALTGLSAVREPLDHPQIRKGREWLLSIQRPDGGFGESCGSDRIMRYSPLHYSTLVQTAWALDALVSVFDSAHEAADRAANFLLSHLLTDGIITAYPTGAGLPGHIYSRYESYPLVWPLLALSHYRNKFSSES
ncbi:terpene cyclase/mutase family protein [Paenibacillus spongiae]|uniref:Squalene--hopene cyclase n=1 Tax=Paenibacillus spongiae TaxID=2909671 RepID=A0ABY5S2V9_9BACL|nr:prenyltransferase/squalene oxidase repeat-containing protein [Paenibacillus spongiae]UVI27788.1 squalene--hopene cyclase [Paenibacillus spongiae]